MNTSVLSQYSRQVRTNAATAYFFLAPVMLLARWNPLYMHEFVRAHAWRALTLQAMLLGYFLVSMFILSEILNFTIPVIGLRVDRLVTLFVCALFLGFTIYSAMQAHRGLSAKESDLIWKFWAPEDNFSNTKNMSETEIVQTLLSYVPFITYFIYERIKTPLTTIWVRFTGLITLLIITSIVFSRGDSAFYALIFLQTLVAVALAFHLILHKAPSFLAVFSYIPSLETVMTYIRTVPRYIIDVTRTVMGRTDTLSWARLLEVTKLADSEFEPKLSAYFTERNLALSPYLIYIPVLNLLFLPKFLRPGKSQFVVAIGQGIALTILCILAGFYAREYLLFALFPITMGMATIMTRPFMRLPILYELSWLLSTLGFGLIQGTRAARAKSEEVREVRLTVD